MGKYTASDVAVPRAAIVTDGLPLKVSDTTDVSSMSLLLPLLLAYASSTALILVEPELNSLVSFRRTVSPPIDTCTIWRSELPPRPGDGGLLFDSTSWGAVPHVPTQWSSAIAETLNNRKKSRSALPLPIVAATQAANSILFIIPLSFRVCFLAIPIASLRNLVAKVQKSSRKQGHSDVNVCYFAPFVRKWRRRQRKRPPQAWCPEGAVESVCAD